MSEIEAFNPYRYLRRVNGDDVGERIMLTDQFRATDLSVMLKTALIAIELLAEKINSPGLKAQQRPTELDLN